VCANVHVDSRLISFCNWCFSQWRVGDCGQPIRHIRQFKHTEASRKNARCSILLDLPYIEYSIKKVLISMVSNISSGRSLSFYRKHHIISFTFQLIFLHARQFISRQKYVKQELSYRKQIAPQLHTQDVEGTHRPKYYTVTLKSRLRVIQGHWKRNHWTDHTRLTISRVIWR